MSEVYAKLDSNIVFSSLWREDAETCKIWITLLALKDKDGVVRQNLTGISSLIHIPVEKIRQAIELFEKPDPNSTTPDFEGRRVERLAVGWRILNHDKYQAFGWSDEKKEYERKRKTRWRDKPADQKPAKDEPVTEDKKPYSPEARALLHVLNEATGKTFRECASSLDPIQARLGEPGVDAAGCRKMILRQVKLWTAPGCDPKMTEYLRPTTLFRKGNFDGYYAAKDLEVNYGNNGRNVPQHVDRSVGTCNEGTASEYEGITGVGVVVPNGRV